MKKKAVNASAVEPTPDYINLSESSMRRLLQLNQALLSAKAAWDHECEAIRAMHNIPPEEVWSVYFDEHIMHRDPQPAPNPVSEPAQKPFTAAASPDPILPLET